VINIYRSVFLNCLPAAQVQVCTKREDALYFLVPSEGLAPEIGGIASEALGRLAANLAQKQIVWKLAALSRLGSQNLVNQVAQPLAQSVKEMYLHLGSGREAWQAREQGPAVLLLASLAGWLKEDDLRRFLLRLVQTDTFNLAKVLLIRHAAAAADNGCVGSMSVILDKALRPNASWYYHAMGIEAFRKITTTCQALDENGIHELAGKHLEMIMRALALSGRTIPAAMGRVLLEITTLKSPNQRSPALNRNDNVSGFAALSKTLVETISALSEFKGSDMMQSMRFQQELTQSIDVLQQFKQ
jgi:hypothetical protein